MSTRSAECRVKQKTDRRITLLLTTELHIACFVAVTALRPFGRRSVINEQAARNGSGSRLWPIITRHSVLGCAIFIIIHRVVDMLSSVGSSEVTHSIYGRALEGNR